jgi:hypothetical protein
VCANRILVQDGVYDAFTKRLAETAGAMKVADGFEPGAVIGPLIDMKAVEKVEAHIADAVKKGAKAALGGKRSALGGTFFEPTVLADVTTDMVITKEGDVWAGGAALPLQDRRRGHQYGQRRPHPSLPRLRGRVREGACRHEGAASAGKYWTDGRPRLFSRAHNDSVGSSLSFPPAWPPTAPR